MSKPSKPKCFQELILTLQEYWARQGCAILQPYDMEMGAGTFHTATTLRALGPKPWYAAYVQPSRRPKDGRYGENPNRLQHYYQFQAILKPSPPDILERYLGSLDAIGIDTSLHDIRFVEDDWESPTLGAWGLGWEVWCDGMEITQFTYFQQVGGIEVDLVAGEITYGLERLAMYLQEVESIFELEWVPGMTYGDVYHQNEVEQSKYNFEHADTEELFHQFDAHERDPLGAMRVSTGGFVGMTAALRQLAEKFTSIQAGLTAVERIDDLLSEPLEIRDVAPHAAAVADPSTGTNPVELTEAAALQLFQAAFDGKL